MEQKGLGRMRMIAALALTVAAGMEQGLAQTEAAPPSPPAPPAAVQPAPAPSAAAASSAAKAEKLADSTIKGLDVFSSDGRQVGKVAKLDIANGKLNFVEILSNGFFGFFRRTYVIPGDAIQKKGGKIELSMTSEAIERLQK